HVRRAHNRFGQTGGYAGAAHLRGEKTGSTSPDFLFGKDPSDAGLSSALLLPREHSVPSYLPPDRVLGMQTLVPVSGPCQGDMAGQHKCGRAEPVFLGIRLRTHTAE